MGELIAPPGRQPEFSITIRKASEVPGQIEQLLRDQMDDIPFSLDATVDRHH